jgi:hypothetical protein
MATPFSDSSLGFVVDSVVANKKMSQDKYSALLGDHS